MKSIDSIVITGATSTSVSSSITSVGLIVVPIVTGIACGLSLCSKVLYVIVNKKYIKYKKQYEKEKDQQTIKSFDKFYSKFLHDNLIDENEYKCLSIIFTQFLLE